MKKLILIFSLLLSFLVVAISQSVPVYTTTAFTAPKFIKVGGTSADTLYASDTLRYSLYIASSQVLNIKIKQTVTKVTGTISDSVYFYGSYDGTTEDVALDTIFNSNISTGKKYLTKTSWASFNYPYLIIKCWDKGGARAGVKSKRQYDIIAKYN